jgi:hypothetical protein
VGSGSCPAWIAFVEKPRMIPTVRGRSAPTPGGL